MQVRENEILVGDQRIVVGVKGDGIGLTGEWRPLPKSAFRFANKVVAGKDSVYLVGLGIAAGRLAGVGSECCG